MTRGTSSPRICDSIVEGLTSAGMRVTVLGLCPTPALYFSLFILKPGAGVMITGSHNPSEFNGFKLCVGNETIYGEEIQKIRGIMEQEAGKADNSQTAAHQQRSPMTLPDSFRSSHPAGLQKIP